MRSKKLLLLIVVGNVVGFSFAAWATHQSFALRGNGQACSSANASSNDSIDYLAGAANKRTTSGVWLTCPVNLSGQFNGMNGGSQILVHATIPSPEAEVMVFDGSPTDSVQCQATATSATQGQFFSSVQSTSVGGTGGSTLILANGMGWGGTGGQALGTAMTNVAIRSLEYICWLPAAMSSSGGRSSVGGYRARICANHVLCAQ